jgi:transcriptional regulator
MYQPDHFREDRIETQHELIRAYPLGLLITAGAGGLLANPIPFQLDTTGGEGPGVLRAHLARANTQWADLRDGGECLVVFQGPQAYVSPSWYATKPETGKVVPTWNYATVHVWGRPRVRDQSSWVRGQIDALTGEREAGRSEPWGVEDAPADFIAAQMRGIVGLELPIDRIEGKWKVSQNRSAADRQGVERGLRETDDVAMADLVAKGAGSPS